jgi:hypothetical protein
VQPEREGGHDAEVAAAAAQRPEQVGVLIGVRADLPAVGQHDLRLEQVVDREAEASREVAEPAAEREAADACAADDAARRGQPVLAGRVVDLAPEAAAADARRPRDGIDLDVLQPRQVDHDAAVAGPQPGAVVAAAPHRDEELVLAGEAERRRDVVRARDARDHAGALVDHRVVDGARVVVVGVPGSDQVALESGQLGSRRLRRARHVAHVCLLCGGSRDRTGARPQRHDEG